MEQLSYEKGINPFPKATLERAKLIVYLPRKMFPALVDNSYAYLNSGGSGPPSYETIRAMREVDDLCLGPAYLEGADFYTHQNEAYTLWT